MPKAKTTRAERNTAENALVDRAIQSYERQMATQPDPVIFRPGPIDQEITARTEKGVSPGLTAKRDLGRYYSLLREALVGIHLSPADARIIVAAVRNWHGWDNYPEAFALRVKQYALAHFGIGPTRPMALADRFERATPTQVHALMDAVERFLNLRVPVDGPGSEEALRKVGLCQ